MNVSLAALYSSAAPHVVSAALRSAVHVLLARIGTAFSLRGSATITAFSCVSTGTCVCQLGSSSSNGNATIQLHQHANAATSFGYVSATTIVIASDYISLRLHQHRRRLWLS